MLESLPAYMKSWYGWTMSSLFQIFSATDENDLDFTIDVGNILTRKKKIKVIASAHTVEWGLLELLDLECDNSHLEFYYVTNRSVNTDQKEQARWAVTILLGAQASVFWTSCIDESSLKQASVFWTSCRPYRWIKFETDANHATVTKSSRNFSIPESISGYLL